MPTQERRAEPRPSLSEYIHKRVPGCTTARLIKLSGVSCSTLNRWWREGRTARVELLIDGLAYRAMIDAVEKDLKSRKDRMEHERRKLNQDKGIIGGKSND